MPPSSMQSRHPTATQTTIPSSFQAPQSSQAAASCQVAVEAIKQRKTVTNIGLAKSRERDWEIDTPSVIPIMQRWACLYKPCRNYGETCYVEDGTHWRVNTPQAHAWASLVDEGNARLDIMPRRVKLYCKPVSQPRPARASRASNKQESRPSVPQGWAPYPPMIPMPYPGMPSYLPQYLPPTQSTVMPDPSLPSSSPPQHNGFDPDELLAGFFDYLIKKNPSQAGALHRAKESVHEEALDAKMLWKWAQGIESYSKLADIPKVIQKRIKDGLKPYLNTPDALEVFSGRILTSKSILYETRDLPEAATGGSPTNPGAPIPVSSDDPDSSDISDQHYMDPPNEDTDDETPSISDDEV